MTVSGGVTERYGPPGALPPVAFPVDSGEDVAAGKLAEFTGAKTIGLCGDTSAACAGVALRSGDAEGDMVEVVPVGYFVMTASGTVNAGDSLTPATGGDVQAAGSGDPVVGKACEDIGSGDTGLCLINVVAGAAG